MRIQPGHGRPFSRGTYGSAAAHNKEDFQEKAAAYSFVFVLILAFVVLFPPTIFRGSEGDVSTALESGGDMATQVVYFSTFLTVIILACLRRATKPFSFLLPAALAIPLLWCWLSVYWAGTPALSARRILFTSMVVVMVVYLVRMLGATKVMNLLFWSLLAFLIGDWLVIPFFSGAAQAPGILDAGEGGWRGLQSDKNTSGPFCAIATLVFLHHAVLRRNVTVALLGAVAGLIFLWMTRSKTSLGFLPLAFFGGFIVDFLYKHPVARMIAGVLFAFTLAFVWAKYGDTILDSIALTLDDPTAFTGRSQIWSVALAYVNDHFLLGSGYGGFWAAGDSSPAAEYGTGWVINVPEAHNGYLDVTVQTGIIGLAIVVVSLILMPFYWLLSSRLSVPEYRPVLASILIFSIVHNLLETSFLDKANGMWVMLIILITVTSELRRETATSRNARVSRVRPRLAAGTQRNLPQGS